MNVLVVSEHEPERRWVAMALGQAWTVSEAANGIEALRLVADGDIDLVVADETTEPFGGLGLARELKTGVDPPAVLILLDRSQDGWLARWSGADRWLVRPVDPFAVSDAAVQITRPRRRAAAAPSTRRTT